MKIKTTPIEKAYDLTKRLDTSHYPQFNADWCKDGFPRQMIADKLARSMNYHVIGHPVYDDKARSFTFVSVKNAAGELETKVLEYKDICELMQWKSFKYNSAKDLLVPVKAPLELPKK